MCTRFVSLSALMVVVGIAVSSAEDELAATKIKAIRSYDHNVGEERHLDINRQPLLATDTLGGVAHPTRPQLREMDTAPYILHATGGKLNKVPAEKVLLPHDYDVNPQSVMYGVRQAPQGTIYFRLKHFICKSTDAGRTWTTHPHGDDHLQHIPDRFAILPDGKWVALSYDSKHGPVDVVRSTDEGRSWHKISEFELPDPYHMGLILDVTCLQDGTVLAAIDVLKRDWEGTMICFRSADAGATWQGPTPFVGWGSEGGLAQTPSGKLLSTIRFQSKDGKLKHVSLAESFDDGHTWRNWRLLTSVAGQAYGYPVALSDGAVVVIHDTRYGPGSPGARAIVSYDEGRTWSNEVYYLDITTFTGAYSQSVVLADDTIVTISGTCDKGNNWEAARTNTDFHAIRWKLVKP